MVWRGVFRQAAVVMMSRVVKCLADKLVKVAVGNAWGTCFFCGVRHTTENVNQI